MRSIPTMIGTKHREVAKRIAIAIEIDQPYPHHLGCYEGILRYAARKPDWQTVVDPFVVGISGNSGVRQYDGIVGRIGGRAGAAAKAAGVPAVNLWINSPDEEVPSVLPDCRAGCRMAAEHLLARGFRCFGYVGSNRDRARRLHLSGFEPPILDRGLRVEKFSSPLRCEADTRVFVRFYNDMKAWLAGLTLPVGLLVSLESVALYIVQIGGELGLRIPHDLGIMVCRENLTICLQTSPTLSCIEDDNERIGYGAAELLDHIMLGKVKGSAEPIWIEPKALQIGGCTDAIVSADPIISHAMRFITAHAHEAITVQDVADAIETSTRTLQQRFTQHLGRSVHSEINRLRIETVKRILIDSDARLEIVALENGFADVSHLVKSFRKATQMTPGAFRRKHRRRG